MKKFFTAFVCAVMLTGCFATKTTNPNVMTYNESQSIRSVKRGVVIAVEQTQVQVEASKNAQAVGAVVGGLIGSQLGQGKGSYVGAGAGAIGGSIAGDALSKKTEMAFLYTVEMQHGGIVTIVQGGNMVPMGSKVLVREFVGGKRNIAVDQSQNMQFQRTNDTKYAN